MLKTSTRFHTITSTHHNTKTAVPKTSHTVVDGSPAIEHQKKERVCVCVCGTEVLICEYARTHTHTPSNQGVYQMSGNEECATGRYADNGVRGSADTQVIRV